MLLKRLSYWLLYCALLLVVTSAAGCLAASVDNTKTSQRVAVMSISGSEPVNTFIRRTVARRHQIISSKRYLRVARKLKVAPFAPRGMRAVSRELDVDTIVGGRFVKNKNRGYRLNLSLRAGNSGRKIETLSIETQSQVLSKRERKKIARTLYRALAKAESEPVGEVIAERGARSHSESRERERERSRKIRQKRLAEVRQREARKFAAMDKTEKQKNSKKVRAKRSPENRKTRNPERTTTSAKIQKPPKKKTRGNDSFSELEESTTIEPALDDDLLF